MREQDLIVASIKSVVGTGAAIENRLGACRARLVHLFEQDSKVSAVPDIAEAACILLFGLGMGNNQTRHTSICSRQAVAAVVRSI